MLTLVHVKASLRPVRTFTGKYTNWQFVVTVNLEGAEGGNAIFKMFELMIGLMGMIGLLVGAAGGCVGTWVGGTDTTCVGGKAGGAISANVLVLPCTVAYCPQSQHVPPVGVLMIQ